MSNPREGWQQVGDRYYRKTRLYTSVFDEDLELENYVVTGAPYSGAVGMRNLHMVSIRANLWQPLFAMKTKSNHIAPPMPPKPPSTYTVARAR